MSMISGLIDRLRIHADLYDGKTQPPMSHELQRPSLAQELREAADTIWQLRDDLQRANAAVQEAEHDESMAWDRVRKAEAENAKLRVERDEWHRVAASKQDIIDHMRNANSENAKLRELVARMAEALGIDCEWADPDWCKSPCRLEFECWPEDMVIRCPAWVAMRELGVEVTE